jgi:hypothetical protein
LCCGQCVFSPCFSCVVDVGHVGVFQLHAEVGMGRMIARFKRCQYLPE